MDTITTGGHRARNASSTPSVAAYVIAQIDIGTPLQKVMLQLQETAEQRRASTKEEMYKDLSRCQNW